MVTHYTANHPVCSLYIGERTGSVSLCSLWSYVVGGVAQLYMDLEQN